MKIEDIELLLKEASPDPLRASPPQYDMDVAQVLDSANGILCETTHHGRMRGDARLWAASPAVIKAMLDVVIAALALNCEYANPIPCYVMRQKYRAGLDKAVSTFEKTELPK